MSSWPYRILASLLTLTSLLASVPATAVGEAPTLTSLTLNPTTVTGGVYDVCSPHHYPWSPQSVCGSGSGTVTLSLSTLDDAVVSLSSSNRVVTWVPPYVTVPAWNPETTFYFVINPVASSTSVTIAASYGGVTKTVTLA